MLMPPEDHRQSLTWTGQTSCHDSQGRIIDCNASGQDAEFLTGAAWPEERFMTHDDTVRDRLTELIWTRSANPAEFPLNWQEALEYIEHMNQQQAYGHNDWRMPNRREMRSLISHQTRRPPLPAGHPFTDVFGNWYWTSTTAAIAPDHAWYVSLDGGRMFFGGKDQSFMIWPVRGIANELVLRTGQATCHDPSGKRIACEASGQDAAYRSGAAWPEPRFQIIDDGVWDRLTARV
ncbi:MAG: DUF1566 domain-containing protein [Candidatus Thiodiazotropha sp.]